VRFETKGVKCDKCNGKGYYLSQNSPDDVEKELCECCQGRGVIYSSEWARDKQEGRL